MKRRKQDEIHLLYLEKMAPVARHNVGVREGGVNWLRKSVRASFNTSITYPVIAETVIEARSRCFRRLWDLLWPHLGIN
jgi:hypothetical protein